MSKECTDIYQSKKYSWPVYASWYLLWFLLVLCLYWPGILVFPKSDHPIFMFGRHLADNDFSWFISNLSYNRTRLIMPGDYFGYRPLLFVVITLEDIFFRNNFMAQGIICCSLFSFAATSFFVLVKKYSGVVTALTVTILWISQLAGSEIVLWNHINPYILAPAFMCIALLVITDENASSFKCSLAGMVMFLACVSHEISVLISLPLAFIVFMSKYSYPEHRKRILLILVVPAALALLLNALDHYIIHPTPTISEPTAFVLNSAIQLMGGIGNALFLPGIVDIETRHGWLHSWKFYEHTTTVITCSIIVLLLVVFALAATIKQVVKNGTTATTIVTSYFLLLFLSASSVCMFRTMTRGIKYMETATYYFSFTSMALCGLIGLALSRFGRKTVVASYVLILLLTFWHIYALRHELLRWEPAKKQAALTISTIRKDLQNNQGVCFKGGDPTSLTWIGQMWGPLFQDYACSARSGATPVYLTGPEIFQLAALRLDSEISEFENVITPRDKAGNGGYSGKYFARQVSFDHPFEFTLKNAGRFSLIMKSDTGYGFGMEIEGNLTWLQLNGQRNDYGYLTWNPFNSEVTYQVRYTESSVLLFGNRQLLYAFPKREIGESRQLNVVLMAKQGNDQLQLIRFDIARNAGRDLIAFSPLRAN